MSTPPRTAREVVELYNLVVWNERDFALAEELIGDTVIRHEVGEANCSRTTRQSTALSITGPCSRPSDST